MNTLLQLVQAPWAQALGWSLLHFLWQGALLGGLAWGLLALLRGAGAKARYAVGCAALLLMVAAPVLTFLHLLAQASPAPGGGEVRILVEPALVQPVPLGLRARLALAPALPWLLAAWAAGVILLSGRFLGGWLRVQRLRRQGAGPVPAEWHLILSRLCRELRLARTVRLLQSAAVEVPTVLGWLRPVILLPACALAGLTPLQLEAVLAHELAHIRRGDFAVNLLQTLVEVLLFYHPAVWWLSGRVRAERELCCDDVAADLCGDPLLLARALTVLEELREPRSPAPSTLALAANGGPLMHRIRHLLQPALPVPSAARTTALALVAASVLGAAGVAFQEKASAPPAAPAAPRAEPETLHLTTVEDGRQTSITLQGDVKATPGAKNPFVLGAGASLRVDGQAGGTSRTYRQDAKGRSYSVDGREQPLDAAGEAWLQEVAKSVEQGRAQAKDRVVKIRGREGKAAGGPPAGVEVHGNPDVFVDVDIDRDLKEVDENLKNLDLQTQGLSEAERARVKAELERAREDMKKASKEMAEHRKQMIILRQQLGKDEAGKPVKVEVLTEDAAPGMITIRRKVDGKEEVETRRIAVPKVTREGDHLVMEVESPGHRKVERRIQIRRPGGDPAAAWPFADGGEEADHPADPQLEIKALQAAMKSMQKRLEILQKQVGSTPKAPRAPRALPPPPPPAPPAPPAPPKAAPAPPPPPPPPAPEPPEK